MLLQETSWTGHWSVWGGWTVAGRGFDEPGVLVSLSDILNVKNPVAPTSCNVSLVTMSWEVEQSWCQSKQPLGNCLNMITVTIEELLLQ